MGAVIPYLRDIIKGTTKPNLVSWITWTLITGIATAAEIAAAEYVTAIFTSAAMLETASVVALGLRRGYVKYTRFDMACQLGAVIGVILWQIFNSPGVAVVASVTIDLIGVLPTLRHSWHKPHEETWSAYMFSGVGGVFAIFALSSYNVVSLTYAVYIVLANVVIAFVIVSRRQVFATR